jgi:hypothetical protein
VALGDIFAVVALFSYDSRALKSPLMMDGIDPIFAFLSD